MFVIVLNLFNHHFDSNNSCTCSKESIHVSLAANSKLKLTSNCRGSVFRGRSSWLLKWLKNLGSQPLNRSRFKKRSLPGLRYAQLCRRLYQFNSVSAYRPIPEVLFETLIQNKFSQTSQHWVAYALTESMLLRLHDRSCYRSKHSSGLATLTGLNYQGSLSSSTESDIHPE